MCLRRLVLLEACVEDLDEAHCDPRYRLWIATVVALNIEMEVSSSLRLFFVLSVLVDVGGLLHVLRCSSLRSQPPLRMRDQPL